MIRLVALFSLSLVGCGAAMPAPAPAATPGPVQTVSTPVPTHALSACDLSWFSGFTSFSDGLEKEYGDSWTQFADHSEGEYEWCDGKGVIDDYLASWSAITFDGKVEILKGCDGWSVNSYSTICNGKPLRELRR